MYKSMDRRSGGERLGQCLFILAVLLGAGAWVLAPVGILAVSEPIQQADPAPLDVEALIEAGGLVELPAGEFTITRKLKPPRAAGLILRGKGPGPTGTTLNWLNDGAGIGLAGEVLAGGVLKNFSYWEISNLTLHGGDKLATAITINCATQGKIDRVLITNFKGVPGMNGTAGQGAAIDAFTWWDSCVTQMDVVKCGDPVNQCPAVRLRSGMLKGRNCNNLTFVGGRYESNPYKSLHIGGLVGTEKPVARCRVNRLVSVKFHSTLPVATPHDHVWLEYSDDNSISGNMTHCGGTGVVQRECFDNTFHGLHLGNSDVAGMSIVAAMYKPERYPMDGITWSKQGGKNKVDLLVNGVETKP